MREEKWAFINEQGKQGMGKRRREKKRKKGRKKEKEKTRENKRMKGNTMSHCRKQRDSE